MLSQIQAIHILRNLKALPTSQLAQVEEFIQSLVSRNSHKTSEEDKTYWTDDDLEDITRAALGYAE